MNEDLRLFLLVVIGGTLGTAARFGVASAIPRDGFPYATLAANISGCFAAGVLVFYAIAHGWFGPGVKAFAAIGFLGAFTTMSTFSVDAIELLDGGQAGLAIAYVSASVLGSLAAGFAGRWVALALPQ